MHEKRDHREYDVFTQMNVLFMVSTQKGNIFLKIHEMHTYILMGTYER